MIESGVSPCFETPCMNATDQLKQWRPQAANPDHGPRFQQNEAYDIMNAKALLTQEG